MGLWALQNPPSLVLSGMFPFSGMPPPCSLTPSSPPLCFWGAHHHRALLEQVLLLRCEWCRGAPSTSCPPGSGCINAGGGGEGEGNSVCTCHPYHPKCTQQLRNLQQRISLGEE